jgi:hypothetical protein
MHGGQRADEAQANLAGSGPSASKHKLQESRRSLKMLKDVKPEGNAAIFVSILAHGQTVLGLGHFGFNASGYPRGRGAIQL